MIEGSLAWNPQATLALVTTSSRASSSPSVHCPNPSPRSEFRSTLDILRPRDKVDHRAAEIDPRVEAQQPGGPADDQQPPRVPVALHQVGPAGRPPQHHGD